MRFRAGQWGTWNVVSGGIFLLALLALLVWDVGMMVTGDFDGWKLFACVAALFFVVVAVAWLGTGLSSWRPVRLERGTLSVPTFDLRRGFRRTVLPIDVVNGVFLDYQYEYHNSRWRLVVERRDGPPIPCESVTSSRTQKRGTAGTHAAGVTAELSAAIKAARG